MKISLPERLRNRIRERFLDNHGVGIVTTTKNGTLVVDPKDGDVSRHLLNRGEYDQPLNLVPRGFVQALDADPKGYAVQNSGRRELAEAIASSTNPLTSRVFVNRVWHWLFGTGIVATPSDFGHAAHHGLSPIERCGVGHLQEGNKITAVLSGNETGRHAPETDVG